MTETAGTTTLYDLLKTILSDTSLKWQEKQKLINEVRKASPASDRWTFRWAIWILGFVVFLTVVALWVLSACNHEIPQGLVAIGSGAAGGLAGLLAPGRNRSDSE